MRLLVTRPEEDADALAAELRKLGHEPVIAPVLAYAPRECDWSQLQDASGLIVTSRNALRALVRSDVTLAGLFHLPLFAVGEATGDYARQLGFRDVRCAEGTGQSLFHLIREVWREERRLVHLGGEHLAFPLSDRLQEEGFDVTRLVCYEMRPRGSFDEMVEHALREGLLDGAILASPRTASIFIDLCERHGLLDAAERIIYFTMSEAISERISERISAPILTAARPDMASLLALLSSKEEQMRPSNKQT